MTKILILGYPYWADVAAGMLRKAGLEASVWRFGPADVSPLIRWCGPLRRMAYLADRPFREARVIHYVGSVTSRLFLRVARRLGKRIVLHWVGTDVMGLRKSAVADRGAARFYRNIATMHFADSPELAEELAALGIHAELFRLLPESVEARDLPMPDKPAVLAYWSPGRRGFYGGDVVDALAEEFKDVAFYVVGSDGAGEPQHPNMKYFGKLGSLDEVYKQAGVFVRMPKHDSLSAMVLEMLARGRWVIYNKPFPHTETAANLDEARAALARCLARQGPNREGQDYVREHFSPQAEAERVAPIYRRLLAERG